EKQLEEARGWLTDLADSNPVFVVPGNHDYAWKGLFGFHSVGTNFKNWYAYLGAPLGISHRTVVPKCWMPSDSRPIKGYGRYQLDDHTMLFYVDSGDPQQKARCARGWISEDMANTLGNELLKFQTYTRIVMLHHHPFSKGVFTALDGADRFMKVLNIAGCDLLLFGHKHVAGVWRNDYPPMPWRAYNPGKQVRCISAAHSSMESLSGQMGGFSLIDIHDVGTKDVSFHPKVELVDFA
ncbi:hypothetical protein DRO27_05330, partial [Candidatus Bathyarchaeota archaeon]